MDSILRQQGDLSTPIRILLKSKKQSTDFYAVLYFLHYLAVLLQKGFVDNYHEKYFYNGVDMM